MRRRARRWRCASRADRQIMAGKAGQRMNGEKRRRHGRSIRRRLLVPICLLLTVPADGPGGRAHRWSLFFRPAGTHGRKCIRGAGPARTEPGGLFGRRYGAPLVQPQPDAGGIGRTVRGPCAGRLRHAWRAGVGPRPVQRVSGTGSAGTRLSDAYKQRDGGFCRTEHADVPAGTEREPAIARALPARQRPLRPHQRRQRRSAAGARRPFPARTATGSRCSCWRGTPRGPMPA